MQNNEVSLETAKRLKAAGFPQTTAFIWNGADELEAREHFAPEWVPRCYAAPTAQELADALPESKRWPSSLNEAYLSITFDANKLWWAGYEEQIAYEGGYFHIQESGRNICEALAALWLKLQEQGK